MSLQTSTLLRSGARRVADPVGGFLFVAFAVAFAVLNGALNTVLDAYAGTTLPGGVTVAEYGVTAGVHPAVAVVAAAVTLFVTAVAAVVGMRLLSATSDVQWNDPVRCLGHRTFPAATALLAAALLGVVAVPLGTALLVLPGVLAGTFLLLVPVVVAVENASLRSALRRSRARLTTGHVAAVGGAFVALVLPGVGLFAAASATYLLPPTVEFAFGVLVAAFLAVLWLGVSVEAHAGVGTGGRSMSGQTQRRSRSSSRAL